MGSSQSQPSRQPQRDLASSTPDTPTIPTIPSRPPFPHSSTSTSSSTALSSLRRLSTFGRRQTNISKRGRGNSAGSADVDQKKRRVDDEDQPMSEAGPSTRHTPTSSTPADPVDPYPQPGGPSDPLINDRIRSLSTIRDTLGPNWPVGTSTPATVSDRLRELHRRSAPVGSDSAPRLADRICTLLGLPSSPQVAETPLPPADVPDRSIEELRTQLEQASADLAETQRQINEVQERLEGVEGPANPSLPQETPGGAAEAQANPRIPAGAVLVIQGLAQTHTLEDSARESDRFSGRGRFSRPRSASDGHIRSERDSPTPERGQGEEEEHNGASLEVQARMIGGLLTVAATATATTLLTPNNNPLTHPTARPTPSGTLSSFLDRFRPQRRTTQSIETALGEYLRDALRDRQRLENGERISGSGSGPTLQSPQPPDGDSATNVSTEFRNFLETLQSDLVGALEAYVGPSSDGHADSHDSDAAQSQPTAPSNTEQDAESDRIVADDETTPDEDIAASQIPSFHHQPGQIQPNSDAQRFGVSGGEDGQPRRLNFFRAHLFPPVQGDSSSAPTSTGDPDGMVPCIFVGVRSISHDPAMTTDELVAHPSFPFVDGHVPPPASANDDGASILSDDQSSTTERPGTPVPSRQSRPDRRSFRERVLDRISSRPPPRPTGPLNTYLVFVIGGYYPRSHPVLSIPNLVTGGPLTDEEMALVSELMGPGKPPTATKADIESSGLEVIDAAKITELGQEGKILENCLDRCLICLGDYESGEECRILKCRHAYHKECVDQWLSQGRNSCPACRTEAVKANGTSSSPGEAHAPSASDQSAGQGTGAVAAEDEMMQVD